MDNFPGNSEFPEAALRSGPADHSQPADGDDGQACAFMGSEAEHGQRPAESGQG